MSEEREIGHESQRSDYSFDSYSRVRDVAVKLLAALFLVSGERRIDRRHQRVLDAEAEIQAAGILQYYV